MRNAMQEYIIRDNFQNTLQEYIIRDNFQNTLQLKLQTTPSILKYIMFRTSKLVHFLTN
jgi:hypothetical protein